ncbi:MAG TPA: hypothetical protein VF028_04575, partial [Actinomycetota bacterium]|nr:hypothetical protein [Actinomycetota bacterium]
VRLEACMDLYRFRTLSELGLPGVPGRTNPPRERPSVVHVLTLPDFDRVGAIQTYWGNPATRTFGELLIDCEEDRVVRAVLVGRA